MRQCDRILVVGGSGFLGSHLVEALRWRGRQQVVSTGRREVSGIQQSLDILNAEECTRLVEGFDCVVNLAGQVTRPMASSLHVNAVGSMNLANACVRGSARLLHVSSVAVHGASVGPVQESDLPDPSTVYGAAKLVSEQVIQAIVPRERLGVIRLSNLFGKGQGKGLLAYLLRCFRTGEPVEMNNDGSMMRHFLHVEDAAAVLIEAIENGFSGLVNVPGPQCCSIREVVASCASHAHLSPVINWSVDEGWDSIGAFDSSEYDAHFSFRPNRMLTDYIREELEELDR